MRRIVPLLFTLCVLGAFGWTLVFLYQKSQAKPVAVKTTQPLVQDLVKKTVATGSIIPRKEVAIKPRVSGVLHRLLVEPGQRVEAGALLGEIRIIPNVVALSAAEARLSAAQISAKNAEREHQRLQTLFADQLISQGEHNQSELQLELAKQEVIAAKDNVQLVREGAIRGSGKVSNQVRSTVAGMVIEVPVKEGFTVIESNTFNEGTTIAAIADMSDLIFQGKVDESEVGKLREGMSALITVGAIMNRSFEGKLEYIAPKGVEKEGTIEFEVRASVSLAPDVFIRANYSATADIVLDERKQVLTLSEAAIQFERGEPYVAVAVGGQQFERRSLKLGLSDGIHVEVLEGLTAADHVEVPNPHLPPGR